MLILNHFKEISLFQRALCLALCLQPSAETSALFLLPSTSLEVEETEAKACQRVAVTNLGRPMCHFCDILKRNMTAANHTFMI